MRHRRGGACRRYTLIRPSLYVRLFALSYIPLHSFDTVDPLSGSLLHKNATLAVSQGFLKTSGDHHLTTVNLENAD